jgi:hypothetical protein
MTKIIKINLTKEQELEREQWAIEEEEYYRTQQAKENAKLSAIEKLSKLGLTEEEAKAIVGL